MGYLHCMFYKCAVAGFGGVTTCTDLMLAYSGCLTLCGVCGVADEHGSDTRQCAHFPLILAVPRDHGTDRGHRVGRVRSLLHSCNIAVLLC
jgi:hypothetical protein